MQYTQIRFAIVLALNAIIASLVAASQDSNSANGIKSTGLTYPLTQTLLSGTGVNIGQVETGRVGKFNPDDEDHSNGAITPAQVFRKTQLVGPGSPLANFNVTPHAEHVASVLISANTITKGVAPVASLHSAALVDVPSAEGLQYENALLTLQNIAKQPGNDEAVRVINNSWGFPLADSGSAPDGTNFLTRGVDWLARRYDVLMVVGGVQEEPPTFR